MAEAPTGHGGQNFVDVVVTDPKNVPDLMLLYGYPGQSSEEAHERLYFSADLSNHCDIPTAAILYRAETPKERDPLGGVTLWVKKGAQLQYKMPPAQQALAHFFAGAITAQCGEGMAPGVGAPQAAPTILPLCGVTRGAACNTHAQTCACSNVVCPTDVRCRADFTPCLNTHANTCQPCGHPTVGAGCQTLPPCTFIGCGHTLACTLGLLCQNQLAAAAEQPMAPGMGALQAAAPTALPPCAVTRGAACNTHAQTCACSNVVCPTDVRCRTDFTPCLNTHANTCQPCGHPTVGAGCQTALPPCTFIGCGHTLACTVGLLC